MAVAVAVAVAVVVAVAVAVAAAAVVEILHHSVRRKVDNSLKSTNNFYTAHIRIPHKAATNPFN